MADIYMHQQLAHDVYESLDTSIKDRLDKAAFFVGSQGPDPYFYRIFSSEEHAAKALGDTMHTHDINSVFLTMAQTVRTTPSKTAYGFLLGYALHFALDTAIHPYVYHHVGIYDKADAGTEHLRGLHLKFERRIDAALIKRDHRMKPHRFPLRKKALPLKQIPTAIKTVMDTVTKAVYDVDNGGYSYQRSYQGMRFVIGHIVRDRFGLKKTVYRFIDRFQKKRDLHYRDLSFHGVDLSFDYLNETNRTWKHPVTGETSQKSVTALYEDAKEESKQLIDALHQYVFFDKTLDVSRLFGNRSYTTGLDCLDKRPMQHFNIFTEPRL